MCAVVVTSLRLSLLPLLLLDVVGAGGAATFGAAPSAAGGDVGVDVEESTTPSASPRGSSKLSSDDDIVSLKWLFRSDVQNENNNLQW
jgi:hypothetical protein